jgi:hypothetical protein
MTTYVDIGVLAHAPRVIEAILAERRAVQILL